MLIWLVGVTWGNYPEIIRYNIYIYIIINLIKGLTLQGMIPLLPKRHRQDFAAPPAGFVEG